jgi:leucyl aminopeptidase (aminopeptidase T)
MGLGTESRAEFYSYELAHAAHKLVTEVAPVQPGQQVVITADTASDARVVDATAQAVYTVGGTPTVIWYQTLPNPCMDPPAPVANALLKADVWIEYATAYSLYSSAYFAAIQAGCRYLAATGMDVDMMVRTIGRVNYPALERMRRVLYDISQQADSIRVTSPAGTDLTMKVDKAGDPFFEPPPSEGGYPIMLGGQSGFMARHDSFEGTLVFDGCIWPPAEIGILRSPVTLRIRAGHIDRIEGAHEAALFRRWLEGFDDPLMFFMDHACYGFNPGVTRPSGRILEDERVFGCMQFGIGPTGKGAPSHTDGVALNPSVWADDKQLEEAGRYVHPELITLCRELGAPGY